MRAPCETEYIKLHGKSSNVPACVTPEPFRPFDADLVSTARGSRLDPLPLSFLMRQQDEQLSPRAAHQCADRTGLTWSSSWFRSVDSTHAQGRVPGPAMTQAGNVRTQCDLLPHFTGCSFPPVTKKRAELSRTSVHCHCKTRRSP